MHLKHRLQVDWRGGAVVPLNVATWSWVRFSYRVNISVMKNFFYGLRAYGLYIYLFKKRKWPSMSVSSTCKTGNPKLEPDDRVWFVLCYLLSLIKFNAWFIMFMWFSDHSTSEAVCSLIGLKNKKSSGTCWLNFVGGEIWLDIPVRWIQSSWPSHWYAKTA